MRSFLFLQGVATPFFKRLARHLDQRGHAVHKINFCGGDRVYWNGLPSWDYSSSIDELEAFLTEQFNAHHFTDVVLFGEQRPVHKIAIRIAKLYGAAIHVFEEGYVRPNWVTLEVNGVNGNSTLHRDATWYRDQSGQFPLYGDGSPIGSTFWPRACYDVFYRLANAFYAWKYPKYRTHRPYNALLEYAGWLRRFPLQPLRTRAAARFVDGLIARGTKFYLLPLQLDSDAQVRVHSRFSGMRDCIRQVVASFSRHADSGSVLIVKNHPLDTSLVNFRRETEQAAREFGVSRRVKFIDGGHLPTILDHCAGVVTINSTVGMQALVHNAPVICLGTAIYDLEGLTFQGGLDAFWDEGPPPDKALVKSFRSAVIDLTQLNGSFYTERGMEMLVINSAERLLSRAPEPSHGPAARATTGPGNTPPESGLYTRRDYPN